MEKDRVWKGEKYRNRSAADRWAMVLKRNHGMAPLDWHQLREAQGGICYLGDHPLPASSKAVHIDHDHGCCPQSHSCPSCRRGLACNTCNAGIGLFGDDPARLRMAADALERAQADVDRRRLTAPQQLTLIE